MAENPPPRAPGVQWARRIGGGGPHGVNTGFRAVFGTGPPRGGAGEGPARASTTQRTASGGTRMGKGGPKGSGCWGPRGPRPGFKLSINKILNHRPQNHSFLILNEKRK